MAKKKQSKKPPPVSWYVDFLEYLDEVEEVAALQRLFREEVGESEVFDRAVAAHLAKLPGVVVVEPGVRLPEDEIRRNLRDAALRVLSTPEGEAEFWQEWFDVDPVSAIEGLRRDALVGVRNARSKGGRTVGGRKRESAKAWQDKIRKKALRLIRNPKLTDAGIGAQLAKDAGRSADRVARYVRTLRPKPPPKK